MNNVMRMTKGKEDRGRSRNVQDHEFQYIRDWGKSPYQGWGIKDATIKDGADDGLKSCRKHSETLSLLPVEGATLGAWDTRWHYLVSPLVKSHSSSLPPVPMT